MPSKSSCTYDDYSRDLIDSEDFNKWSPSMLDNSISNQLLGFQQGVISVSPDETISNGSITVVDMMTVDEYTFEVLVPIPSNSFMTVSYLLDSKINDMLVCMSNYSQRNFMFGIQGCVLCINQQKATVYIPSTVKKSVWKDLNARSLECSRAGIFNGSSYHRVQVPANLLNTARLLFNQSKKINMNQDHKPMVLDGYTMFCRATPIICIKAKSQKETTEVHTNEPVDEILDRKIVIKLLHFMECIDIPQPKQL